MNQRFAIPALCALLFHAVLLFGFGPSRAPVVYAPVEELSIVCMQAPTLDEPIEVRVDNGDEEEPKEDLALGNDDAANPTGEDRSKLAPDRSDFPVPLNPVRVETPTVTRRINPGPIGVPKGMPDGIRLGGSPLRMDQLDRIPRVLAQVSPVYPVEARRLGPWVKSRSSSPSIRTAR